MNKIEYENILKKNDEFKKIYGWCLYCWDDDMTLKEVGNFLTILIQKGALNDQRK